MLDHFAEVYEGFCNFVAGLILVLGGILGVIAGWSIGKGVVTFIAVIFGLVIGILIAYIFDVLFFGTMSQVILIRKYTRDTKERLEEIEKLIKEKN